MRIIKSLAKSVALTYLASGLVYYLAGYLYNFFTGKPNIFSPLLAIPMVLIGWPEMVYADLKHMGSIGVKPAPFLAILSVLLFLVVWIRKWFLL